MNLLDVFILLTPLWQRFLILFEIPGVQLIKSGVCSHFCLSCSACESFCKHNSFSFWKQSCGEICCDCR